jgi:hypothetical protein
LGSLIAPLPLLTKHYEENTMGTPRPTTNAKDVVITALTCGLTSLLGTIIFFFFWSWVGYYDEQGPFPGILNGAAFSLIGGIVAGVTGIRISNTNEKLRRGICGAIAGLLSMVAVEQIVPTSLFAPAGLRIPFASFDPLSSQIFALMLGIIAGASAGSFSALYIGKPAYHVSIASAAQGCGLASFLWVLAASLILVYPDLDAILFTLAILGSGIIAIIGAVIGGILGGLFGLFGNLIGYAGNRMLSNLVGLTCGATLGAIITMILLAGQLSQ